MSSNVGLSTPRGSGTSGYVQRSSAFLRPRDDTFDKPADFQSHQRRQPDAAILEHDRKRQVEVKVFELRDKLEDEGKDEDEIDDACDALRKKLQRESQEEQGRGNAGGKGPVGRLKSHQVHEIARAKIQEDEKLRRALGISKEYEEGSHWRRQEERKREVEVKRAGGGEQEKKVGRTRERSRSVSDRSRSPRRSRSPVRRRRTRSRSVSSRSGSDSD
ncbi:hypothetical protein CAC42_1319 [Sphaceloma murrayae]|uniref:CWF21 domain-containing protein n=1 Tax=Sphaceloma murrayae TaxID=2082308 RepID=A0A2K1QFI0_9PEZI|nr:hypothetical protein CAC42_1319 [Sphaceloma murrayae]